MTTPSRSAVDAPAPGLVIRRAGIDAVDQLRELWDGMHEHHAQVATRVAETWPFRSNASSWAVRRESYQRWLEEPGAFLLIASRTDASVGYLFGRPLPGWTAIDTRARIGEIESLTVHPNHRGCGIGGQLMSRAHEEFAALGIDTVALSVFAENTDAIRFYDSFGMTPTTITYLGRVGDVVAVRAASRDRVSPASAPACADGLALDRCGSLRMSQVARDPTATTKRRAGEESFGDRTASTERRKR